MGTKENGKVFGVSVKKEKRGSAGRTDQSEERIVCI